MILPRGKNVSKFNVSKEVQDRTYNGIVFDSVMEMQYYRDVILPGIAEGKIKDVELQRPYTLIPGFRHDDKYIRPMIYVADFVITYEDDHQEVIDIKGFAESASLLKRKLFWYAYPELPYYWITYSKIDGGWVDYDVVKRNRAKRKKEKQESKQIKMK